MKNKFLIFSAFIFICSMLLYGYQEINTSRLATDSGFDVSYDGGGSSDSGGYWGDDHNHSYGSSSSSGSDIYIYGPMPVEVKILLWGIFFFFIGLSIWYTVSIYKIRKKSKDEEKEKNEIIWKQVYPNIDFDALLNEGYQIYLDVQKAWMNFDYETLRNLVSDELYNSYINQLDTLATKKQKNVMIDFKLEKYNVSSYSESGNIVEMEMFLRVNFRDYVMDINSLDIVRGTNIQKVVVDYRLTFVWNKNETLNKCPSCGADVNNKTVCEFCGTHITTTDTKMRLTKKEAIHQKMKK